MAARGGDCYNFPYDHSRAHLRRARPTVRAVLAACARDARGALNELGECRAETATSGGESRRRWRGSLARFL
jgi:hypothetical protein